MKYFTTLCNHCINGRDWFDERPCDYCKGHPGRMELSPENIKNYYPFLEVNNEPRR